MFISRLSARPRRTLLAVLLFVVVAGVIGGPVAGRLTSSGGFVAPGADSQLAVQQIVAATGAAPDAGVVVLVDHPTPARVRTVADRLGGIRGVVRTATPGRGLVTGTLSARASGDGVANATLEAFAGRRDVSVGGPVVADAQIGSTVGGDLGRAELIAFPILILLSLLFFRGRATLLPLVVGATTVLGTFLALSGINEVYGLNVFALNLVIGLGLGLSIDYTLFLLTRYREELARQGATAGAIRTTLRTAGRTVAFSAATVAGALITLTVFPQLFLKSMGIAGATVAVVAALVALVVSPAVFGLWGVKLERRREGDRAHGRWHRLAHAVMRRPGLVAGVTALIMLVVALPSLSTHWSAVDGSVIPESQSSRTVADALAGGTAAKAPVLVALAAPASAGADVAAYARRGAALHRVERGGPPPVLGGGAWPLDVGAAGDPAGPVAQRVVQEVRDLPASFDAR